MLLLEDLEKLAEVLQEVNRAMACNDAYVEIVETILTHRLMTSSEIINATLRFMALYLLDPVEYRDFLQAFKEHKDTCPFCSEGKEHR